MRIGSIVVLFSAAVLLLSTGCGGSVVESGGPQQTAKGSFTKEFGPSADRHNNFPFSGRYDTKTQYLYTPREVGGSGIITKLRLRRYYTGTTTVTCPNTTVKMGHTTVSALTTTWADNVENGAGTEQTVLNNATITIPAADSGTWIDITLTTPFDYNGVDNLVVDFERATKCTVDVPTTTYSAWTGRRAHASATDTIAGTPEFDAVNATGVDTSQPWMQFVFAGGDNTVRAADGTSDSGSDIAPANAGRTQLLILASDINGSGPITGMAIRPSAATTEVMLSGVSVVLSNVPPSVTDLGADFAANRANATSSTTVASGMNYTVPGNLSGPVWIPFNGGAFNYDGTSNILVDITVSSATGTYDVACEDTPTNRIVASLDPEALAGNTSARSFEPVFRFNGGTMDTVTAGSSNDPYPFSASLSVRRQYLYPAAMLGTKGAIDRIAFRLKNDSAAGTYDNFEVVMGHTSASGLTSTFADNLADQTTVFNGTVTITAGLKAGDWIEIPLSHSFSYDGTRNLVVQVAADPGTAQNSIVADGPGTEYANYHLFATDRSFATGTLNSSIADQRLWLK